MNFSEYRVLAQRTNPDLGSLVLNTIHMSVGMASESYELAEATVKKDKVNVGEEIADKLWYLAGYLTVNNLLDLELEFDTIKKPVEFAGEFTDEGAVFLFFESMLLDYDKKFLAYGKERDITVMKQVATNLFYSYNNLIIEQQLSASTIMTNNINKLKVRFADKFTTEEANTRDLDAERAELEK